MNASQRHFGRFLAVWTMAFTASAETTTYDADPGHPWNVVFDAFYRRNVEFVTREWDLRELHSVVRGRSVQTIGPDVLDPPLGRHPRYVLADEAFARCNGALDRFIEADAARLIDDPLKRAVFQRDLWAVFDLLSLDADAQTSRFFHDMPRPPYSSIEDERRKILSEKIARVMCSIALPREDFDSLPDNYGQAVKSGEYSSTPVSQRDADYLPAGLFDAESGWREISTETGLTRHFIAVQGRSIFRIFVKFDGVKAGEDQIRAYISFVNALEREDDTLTGRSFKDAVMPEILSRGLYEGIQFALIRQMVSVDSKGQLVVTPIVESIQVRVSRDGDDGSTMRSFVFKLDRNALFEERNGGLRPVTVGDSMRTRLDFLGRMDDSADDGHMSAGRRPFPQDCTQCHNPNFIPESMADLLGRPIRLDASRPLDASVAWKADQANFQHLRDLWRSQCSIQGEPSKSGK